MHCLLAPRPSHLHSFAIGCSRNNNNNNKNENDNNNNNNNNKNNNNHETNIQVLDKNLDVRFRDCSSRVVFNMQLRDCWPVEERPSQAI